MANRIISFESIKSRAESRKGGVEALTRLLPPVHDKAALQSVTDDRFLAEMTKRVFCAGFAWNVIEAKWPGFEEAFLRFDPVDLIFQPDDYWDALTADKRIVRNGAKIMSVRHNAHFVHEIADQYGSFGKFLSQWPSTDQIGLLDLLVKRGNRLGGNSGQMFLRFMGWDGFVTSKDVIACMRDAGLDIGEEAKSKSDMRKVQALFNHWVQETGLSYTHISRICALSIGADTGAGDH